MAKTPPSGQRSGASKPGRLRIVAGKWRRRLLPVANVEGLRPTPERVRETLFNWLAPVIDGARCLDLCAGSGALGFEALSRGAARACLVERSPLAARVLREAAASLDTDAADIVQADAIAWLRDADPQPYDIVFLDPPFAGGLLPPLCAALAERGWLAAGARLYVEQGRGSAHAELPANWQVLKEKVAGQVRYMLLTPVP